ncbi:MAG: ATP-binding protein [Blastocatellia bacterium]|nr:ATP-binding protein [Blastocatellia bacterium]
MVEQASQEERVTLGPEGPSVPFASRLIYLFESDVERTRFAQFIALGLAQRDKCVIATDLRGRELFSEALDRLGVEVDKHERDASLVIITDEITVESIEALARSIFDYRRARCSQVRLINDTSYMKARGFTARDFLHLEGTGHLFIRRQPCTTLCQYDTREIERSHLQYIIAAHQFTIACGEGQKLPRLEENPDPRSFTQIIFDGMDEQLRVLTRLQNLSLKLTASLGLDEALDAIIEAAMTISRADRAAISCMDDQGDFAILKASGLSEDYINRRQVNRENPLVAKMIATRRPSIIEDVDRVAHNSPNYPAWKREGINSVVGLPLISEGKVFGIIIAASSETRRYTQTEIDAMAILAAQASATVINARLYDQLREANQAKDDFLATLSHEMRTPLTPILGWMHILKPYAASDPLLAEGIESIERNARHQAGLINDLLDLTRIISGKTELFRQPTDLNALVRSAVDLMRSRAIARNITLHLSLPSETIVVYLDPLRIQQVASNLLDNAMKFTPEGGQVWVSLKRGPTIKCIHSAASDVLIEVADTGAGIEPEFLPQVFDRFTQAHQGINRLYGGLGLGLAIARAMVELHGGKITAHSEGAHQGSRFTVSLPDKDDFGVRSPEVTDEPETGEEEFGRLALYVLLIEDVPDALTMMEMWLKSAGCEVRAATEAAEGMRLAAERRPDLIISDIGLPEIDGYEMMRNIRRMPGLESVPAIALSGYAREEDESLALAAGYDAHMAKPVEMCRLLGLIKELTSRVQGSRGAKEQRSRGAEEQ